MTVTAEGRSQFASHTTVSVLGHRVQRREDPPLVTGEAEFLADVVEPGALTAVFVRSTVAHGVLRSVDLASARDQPGVVAVFAATDLPLPPIPEWPRADGPPREVLARPCLATGRVRYVGEPVAVVVAETQAQAVDAAEQVVVDVDPLPVVTDPLAAMEEGAPVLFEDFGSNLVLEALTTAGIGPIDGAGEPIDGAGDPIDGAGEPIDGAGDPLEGADVVVRGRFVNQRVAAVPMETGGILARPHPDGVLECLVSCQAPFAVRNAIAGALGKAEDEVWVRTPAVGGGFGAKGGVYPEQLVVAAVADRLGRPVRHAETRSENLVAMSHGRGQVQDVALGARRDGTIVGLAARTVTDMGGYCSRGGIPFRTSRLMATGVYRVPRLSLTSLGAVTNTTPIGPYRGAGRPEAAAMMERAIDLLASELDLDPVEVRRKNLLGPEDFPYRTATGAVYDTGDYSRTLDHALELAGYAALREEQQARRRSGAPRQLGIGISTFVEISGAGFEYGAVAVEPDGSVVVTTGSSPHGQGHETTLTQVVSARLGVPPEVVRVVHSDTRRVARGIGTFGSRSGQLAGNAVDRAAGIVLEQARDAAAQKLEAAVEDVVVADGGFSVAGVPAKTVTWAEAAAASPSRRLWADGDFAQDEGTYPFGAHVAVVEVDMETGRADLVRFVAVDDCGTVVNPTIVEGQVHGGVVQGVAQALYEEVRYDDLGNPLTATLADYGMPSAAELCSFELGETVTPSTRNPLGMKGVGESGTVGSTVAVQNAVIDALRPCGVRHLDMPLTAERIWQAIRAAGGAAAGAGN